ncbi:MAG: adenylate kinase [Rickettsiales bacterium]|nr:adenylate kinase [Rickettsiales bacterium]|tara:strand:+ start:1101 stop:1676 length:576 start_codon:yes stop_codon:yes gene_type:complete
MKKIVLLGPPGCGKGTQSKILVDNFDFKQLSTGDLLRNETEDDKSKYGKLILEIMRKGELVSDEIVIELIVKKMEKLKQNNVVFDGFPRNISQAKVLDDSLNKISLKLNSAILIDVNFDILEGRIRSRISESDSKNKRQDDNVETLLNRIEVYKENTFPIVKYYEEKGLLSRVDGMNSIEQVSKNINDIIN